MSKLIRMANQIAAFHATQPKGGAQPVADHLNDFWTPDMRADLVREIGEEATMVHPLVIEAATLLRLPNQ